MIRLNLIFADGLWRSVTQYSVYREVCKGTLSVFELEPYEDLPGESMFHVAVTGWSLKDSQDRIVEPDLYELGGEDAEALGELLRKSMGPSIAGRIADLIWKITDAEVFVEAPLSSIAP